MRRALLLVPLLLAACGGGAGDLLAIDRSGEIPGADLRLVIGDGGLVRCNDAEPVRLPDDLLLEARDVERALEGPAEAGRSLPPRPGSILRYAVGTPTGDVRFADNSRGRPAAFDRLVALTRTVAQDVCDLPR